MDGFCSTALLSKESGQQFPLLVRREVGEVSERRGHALSSFSANIALSSRLTCSSEALSRLASRSARLASFTAPPLLLPSWPSGRHGLPAGADRKSTRLNSSHV